MRLVATALGGALCGLAAPAHADLLHQDIAVDLTEPNAVAIDLEATMEFASSTGHFDMVLPPLPVVDAQLDGLPATVGPHPLYPTQLVRITFPGRNGLHGPTCRLRITGDLLPRGR